MPVAIPAVLAGIGAFSGGFLGIAAGWGAALAAGVSTIALSFASDALAGNPREAPAFKGSLDSGITKQVRQPVTAHKLVYGEVRTSGSIIFIGGTNDNKYLHIVLHMANHEVKEIGEIWVNDVSVPSRYLDGSGNVTDGIYSGKMRIQKGLGSDLQTANASLVAEVPEWSPEHRLQGIAYLYVRMEFDRDVYPSGVPNFSAWVKGKKVYDPRTGDTLWSNNCALLANEYLTDETYGFRAEKTTSTFSRGTTATYYGSDGLMKTAQVDEPRYNYDPITLVPQGLMQEVLERNFLIYSEDLAAAVYSPLGFNIIAGQSLDQYGNKLVGFLQEDTSTGQRRLSDHVLTVYSGKVWTASVFVKPSVNRKGVSIYLASGPDGLIVDFNLEDLTGIIGYVGNSSGHYLIEEAANGFYRISMTLELAANVTALGFHIYFSDDATNGNASYTGDGVSGIQLWGAMVERGGFVTSYIPSEGEIATRHGDSGTITEGRVNQDSLINSVNNCDEMVTTTDVLTTVVSVDGTLNSLTLEGGICKYQTGDKVKLTSTGTLPNGGYDENNLYCIIEQRKDTPTIKLADSLKNALAGVAVNQTNSYTGTITVTKTAEPRYQAGGIVETDKDPVSIADSLAKAMAGKMVKSGTSWDIVSGVYQVPSFEFSEDDIVGGISTNTKDPIKNRFNTVLGKYVSPLNLGQPADYPQVENSTLRLLHGKRIIKQIDHQMVQRPHQAQRVAKIAIEKALQQFTFVASFKLTAMKVKAGDVVYLTIEKYGWSKKLFEVVNWKLVLVDDGEHKVPTIEMTLRETAASTYDWNNGEETHVDPAPNTTLPSAFNVAAPTSLAAQAFEIDTATGDKTYKFRISWSPPANTFVINGGHFEVEFKKSSDATWQRSFRAEDSDTFVDVNQVDPNTNYDVRVVSVNTMGVRSTPSSLLGFTVGSPGGATTQLDYDLFSNAATVFLDYGSFGSAPTATLDYGTFT